MRLLSALLSVAASQDFELSQGNRIYENVDIDKSYEVSFDFKLNSVRSDNWSNVLDTTIPGVGANPGARCPSIFLATGESYLHICTYIDGDWNHCFNTQNLNLGQFYNVRVTQYEADDGIYDGVFAGRHMWEVYMDGVKVYSVLNPDPQKFEGASVWLSNGWPSTDGEIENFSFTLSKPSTLTPHQINPNLDQLFIDQYKIWSCFRDAVTGFYCDGQSTTAVSSCANFFSAASTGWGLMIDAVAAETGLISQEQAKRRALETMRSIDSLWPRDSNGWFNHWTERDGRAVAEYSTIDSAIMISGAYFAAKYFNDAEMITLAKSIGTTPDYDLIFDGDNGDRMYMVSNGNGAMSAQTAPFNEYYLLSYLAMVHEADGKDRAKRFFEDCFGTTGKPIGRNGYPHTTSYNGHEMMSDGHWLVTTFTVQFPWFAVKGMHDNPFWSETVYPSWVAAERDWWTRSDGANVDWAAFDTAWGVSGTEGRAFGCGAGDSPNDYFVQSMDGSHDQTYKMFSAANMAPFMAVDNKVEEDLNWLYDNDVTYTKSFWDGSTAKLLWRYSAAWTWWRAGWMTSVDYSTMVLGYALKHLPADFYPNYNSAILTDQTTTTTLAPTTTTTKATTTTTTPKPTTTKTTTTTEQMTDEDWCEAKPWTFHVGKRGKVLRRGENSLILRVKQPVPKSTQYTTMIAFSRSLCGGDFIKSIAAGEITVDLLDNEAMWTQHDSYFRDDRDMSRFVVNFMKIDGEGCDKCLGNNKIDNYDMIVSGIKDIKWKTNAQACIQGAKHAFVGCKNDPVRTDDTNATKCAAWQKLDTKMNMKNCPK